MRIKQMLFYAWEKKVGFENSNAGGLTVLEKC